MNPINHQIVQAQDERDPQKLRQGAPDIVSTVPTLPISALAEQMLETFEPAYVIDIGCHFFARQLTRRPNTIYVGIYDAHQAKPPISPFANMLLVPHDFLTPLNIEPDICRSAIVLCALTTPNVTAQNPSLAAFAGLAKHAPWALACAPAQGGGTVVPSDATPLHDALTCASVPVGFLGWDRAPMGDGLIGPRNEIAVCGQNAVLQKSPEKSLLVMLTTYNDLDIISFIIEHILSQGAHLYILDNWSADGTWELIGHMQQRYPDQIVGAERFPKEGRDAQYNWHAMLERQESLAATLTFDWYMSHGSDEIRKSPWQKTRLVDAIAFVDAMGYTSIDFTQLDFRPTKDGYDGSEHPETFFGHFEYEQRPNGIKRINAWKRHDGALDLASTGGHVVNYPGQRVYPINFIIFHYSLRSQNQAARKIYKERLPRFEAERAQRDWHSHYDHYKQIDQARFIWDAHQLHRNRPESFYRDYFATNAVAPVL